MPKHRQTFYLSASTQFSNAGDALINRELIALLREFGQIRIARAGAPLGFLEEIRLDDSEIAFKGKRQLLTTLISRAILDRKARQHYLVLTPGDPPGHVSYGDRVRAILFPILKFLGVRIIKIGASVSRMDPARLRLEARLSRSLYYYGLRDSGSVDRAHEFSFANFGYCPDLAFNLQFSGRPSSRDRTLVSLREDNLNSREVTALHSRVRTIIDRIAESPGIESVEFVSQVERDSEAMDRLSVSWRGSSRHSRHLSKISELEAEYSSANFVVSNRLHVILLAASQAALPLCVATDSKNAKITELLSSVGLGNLVVQDNAPLPALEEGLVEVERVFAEQRALLHELLAEKLGK